MTKQKKKVQSGNSGLSKKTNTSGALVYLSDLNIHTMPEIVKLGELDKLGQPRRVLVCWACGTSQNVTKYHAAGGALGVCIRCNGGQVE